MSKKLNILDLKDKLSSYKKGREEYLELIEIAEDNLKEYDKYTQSALIEDIKQRQKEEKQLFYNGAKHLYKNRDEIISNAMGFNCIIDFLEFDYAKKVFLRDLLNAWEAGLTWLDEDGNECLVIGLKNPKFDRSDNPKGIITYLKGNDEWQAFVPAKEYDAWFYSVKPDITKMNLTEGRTDFDNYITLSEIPACFLGIEEW